MNLRIHIIILYLAGNFGCCKFSDELPMPFSILNIRTPQDSDVEPIVPENVRFVGALLIQTFK